MREIRIFQDISNIYTGKEILLDKTSTHYLLNVLRINKKTKNITIFDGKGGNYLTEITTITKNKINIVVKGFAQNYTLKKIKIHLCQSLICSKKIDLVIQKSVELGVDEITFLSNERSVVRINLNEYDKKIEHWRKIVINSCSQCGRDNLMVINKPVLFNDFIVGKYSDYIKLILDPESDICLVTYLEMLKKENYFNFLILVGPEGGFTNEEKILSINNEYISCRVGNRVLRTETTPIVVSTILQTIFGDFRY